VSWTDVTVQVNITSLLGTRLGENPGSEPVRFDLNARLDEKERRNGRVIVMFGLSVRTKPNVAKYEIEGTATLTGKDASIEQILKVDPKSNIPYVFHRIYQNVFTALYVFASLLGTIYPPPDLLGTNEQGVPIKKLNGSEPAENGKPAQAKLASGPAEVVGVKTEEAAPKQATVTT